MADPSAVMADPVDAIGDVGDPEGARRRRYAAEGGIRLAVGLVLLLLQLLLWYDSNAWLQVIATLVAFFGLVTGVGMLIRAAFGSHTDPATWMSVAWLAVLLFFVFLQVAGFFDSLDADFQNREQPPKFTTDEPLGTDQLGKSILTQSIRGARVSLIVGLGAVTIGLIVGTVIGLTAGFFRGPTEGVFNIFTDALLAFPALILLFSIVAIFGGSGEGTWEVMKITLALAVLSIPTVGRLARANTLTFAAREFVTAAKAMGASNRRIIFREILPNVSLPLASYAFIIVAVLIVAEASLSFLGVGINQITSPTWGNMISEGRDPNLLEEAPHIVFVPGVLMFLTVLSLNRIGEALRAIWDPREAKL
ncbi:ABC transporter permease [Candidatus Poriferisocius sp.]|uniref:ABC transporter permease n=1 Tax=Candidatus Poriferisocius sp. TaxID=3101276 RepID=UPI003B5BCD13